MPAQSRGAAAAGSRFDGNVEDEGFVDDDALGVAAVGDAAQVLVGAVVGEGGAFFAELLEAALALRADAIRSRPCSRRRRCLLL